MFQYIKSIFASTFDHPVVVAPFVIAAVLAIVGAVFAFLTAPTMGWPHPIVFGFFGVYAVLFAIIGAMGYVILYAYKYFSIFWERMEPTTG